MYELIEHRRLDANTSTIEFSNIPQNYSDLVILLSLRSTRPLVDDGVVMTFNSQTTNRSSKDLYGLGSGSPASGTGTVMRLASCPAANSTASTFGNTLVHIPNYSGNTAKSSSVDGVMENNATYSVQTIVANLWNQTTAVSSIQISAEIAQFTQHSSATLYGVNRRAGIGRAPLAMGGYMSYSNGYWVHTFPSSGSFIPFTNMDVEYLVVAGGGSGTGGYVDGSGGIGGGGGGAGGFRTSAGPSGGGALAESSLALSAGVNYTVTVGAGAPSPGTTGFYAWGIKGSDSIFHTITSTGGGAGRARLEDPPTGVNGGSGSGGISDAAGGAGGNGTNGQGYAGGNGQTGYRAGAGGGGAGQIGFNSVTSSFDGGAGGDGVASTISGSLVTYAGGGGGGGGNTSGTRNGGNGGAGGGGRGGNANGNSGRTSGLVNTGGGGGGGGGGTSSAGTSGAGGSGIVIVRYRA